MTDVRAGDQNSTRKVCRIRFPGDADFSVEIQICRPVARYAGALRARSAPPYTPRAQTKIRRSARSCAFGATRPRNRRFARHNPGRGILNYPDGFANLMAAKKPGVALVEASANRIVVDTRAGRIIVEPEAVRFHRSGRGRGRVLLGPDGSS